MRFVRDGAYSSAYWLIWRLRRPRFHDVPQISCTTWCEIQTFGFVNASILLIKIGDVKLRERWIWRWQKKSKLVASLPGGKVTVNLSADQLVQFGAPQGLTGLITLETFSKLIVEAGGCQQRARISECGSSRELYPTQNLSQFLSQREDRPPLFMWAPLQYLRIPSNHMI